MNPVAAQTPFGIRLTGAALLLFCGLTILPTAQACTGTECVGLPPVNDPGAHDAIDYKITYDGLHFEVCWHNPYKGSHSTDPPELGGGDVILYVDGVDGLGEAHHYELGYGDCGDGADGA